MQYCSEFEMYHIDGGCVAPSDVNLVEGPGRIYNSAIYKLTMCWLTSLAQSFGLHLCLSLQEILNDTRAVLFAYGLLNVCYGTCLTALFVFA